MGLQVVLEQLVLGEGESTDLAGVAPVVDLLVSPQGSGSREAPAADVAAVWFHSGVSPHVGLHVLELLPADVTRLAATADVGSVRSEMVEWFSGGSVTFSTDATRRFWVLHVGFQVFHQIPFADAAERHRRRV